MERLHNKSNKAGLSFLEYDDIDIHHWEEDILVGECCNWVEGLIPNSNCFVPKAKDGRYTVDGKKVAFCYQIIAYGIFGPEALSKVPASKARDDLTISHLCGTRNCCTPDHIILEPKWINDLRTHCHYCISNSLKNVLPANRLNALTALLNLGICPHTPHCCTLRSSQPQVVEQIF
jgi:hypothetical protein